MPEKSVRASKTQEALTVWLALEDAPVFDLPYTSPQQQLVPSGVTVLYERSGGEVGWGLRKFDVIGNRVNKNGSPSRVESYYPFTDIDLAPGWLQELIEENRPPVG
jgi:hypothetical protein